MSGGAVSVGANRIFDGVELRGPGRVTCADGRIVSMASAKSGTSPDLPNGAILAPGFIDLQVNGGGGAMVQDDPSPARLAAIAAAHAGAGTTTIFPTLISGTREAIAGLLNAVASAGRPPVGEVALRVELAALVVSATAAGAAGRILRAVR